MTSAGAASLAFAKSDGVNGTLSGAPDYWAFGRNPDITELELSNALQRMREPDEAESVESISQRVEGAFTVEATVSSDVHNDVEDLVFNDGGTSFTPGRSAVGRVFTGIDYLSGTAERELIGCIPLDYTITYEEGGLIRYTLSMAYADEELNTSITPSSVTQVSDGTSAPWHDATFSIDTTDQSRLRSATLSISNISRFRPNNKRVYDDAVLAAPETTLDLTAVITGTDNLALAYGGTSATTTQDSVSAVDATVDLSAFGTSISTYSLSNTKPATNSWQDVINSGDTDAAESFTLQVNGVSV
jgi:hypothetical protein